jgi:hypothetical protein
LFKVFIEVSPSRLCPLSSVSVIPLLWQSSSGYTHERAVLAGTFLSGTASKPLANDALKAF